MRTGHITAAPYFSSVESEENSRSVAADRSRYGKGAPIGQYAASGYAALRLFAAALEVAGEMDTQRIAECARGLEMEAPQRRIILDEDNNHTWLTSRVDEWNGVDGFDVVWTADQPIRPDAWLVGYGGVEGVSNLIYQTADKTNGKET
ncbi:MAG: transporter substrate-binding protein [Betaproteobacteria bacterium]